MHTKIYKKHQKKPFVKPQNGFVPIYFDFTNLNILTFKCLWKIGFLVCPCFFGLGVIKCDILALFRMVKSSFRLLFLHPISRFHQGPLAHGRRVRSKGQEADFGTSTGLEQATNMASPNKKLTMSKYHFMWQKYLMDFHLNTDSRILLLYSK